MIPVFAFFKFGFTFPLLEKSSIILTLKRAFRYNKKVRLFPSVLLCTYSNKYEGITCQQNRNLRIVSYSLFVVYCGLEVHSFLAASQSEFAGAF